MEGNSVPQPPAPSTGVLQAWLPEAGSGREQARHGCHLVQPPPFQDWFLSEMLTVRGGGASSWY